MKIAIVGAGAAGFFSAICAKENYPDADIVIFEKSKKVLSKVKVSGGGRCNVTNGCTTIKQLANGYPRGGKQLKKAFQVFNNTHIQNWFKNRGIALKTESDNRVFPVSDNSQTIIDCLWHEAMRLRVDVNLESNVTQVKPDNEKFVLELNHSKNHAFDKVIIASGGSPKKEGLQWLNDLGHQIEDPAPSLFTFNMPQETITQLMGVSAEQVIASIEGTKLQANGPLLITHWGMSGPAILKLSSFGARVLQNKNYKFNLLVNWVNELNQDAVDECLTEFAIKHSKKQLGNSKPFELPSRLWKFLLKKSALSLDKEWQDLGKKGKNKLISILCNDVYSVEGKTTFKEEFVTCGGISLDSVNFNTMQSKKVRNLYFAGEILDIDGITGGYNFQAAWTTAFIAARLT